MASTGVAAPVLLSVLLPAPPLAPPPAEAALAILLQQRYYTNEKAVLFSADLRSNCVLLLQAGVELCTSCQLIVRDVAIQRYHTKRAAAPAQRELLTMFLGALLASRGSSPSTSPSPSPPSSTRRHRKRTRYDSDDDDSDDDGGSSTRRRRVGAGGAGGGAGAGSSNRSRAGAARKVSIPAAGGYDMLKVVPLTKANPSTRGPNLTASDEGSLVTVRTRFAGINYADICVRWYVSLAGLQHSTCIAHIAFTSLYTAQQGLV